ncbi:hypothetical protein C8Q75DRAFT_488679 [Abortiporus biennis]|nr:hypothetical protein C8Q75DRAFT_488679 [Abortiporus biennis]
MHTVTQLLSHWSNTNNPSTSLYPELVDIVMDHLYNDKTSLSRCSLVCRSWLSSCRFHLFSTMSVYHTFPVSTRSEGFHAFNTVLSTPSGIGPFIRNLTLTGTSNSFHTLGDIIVRCDASILLSILSKLHNLQSLKLFQLDLRGDLTTTRILQSTSCPTRNLHLDSVEFWSQPFDLYDVLGLCSNLDTLFVKNVYHQSTPKFTQAYRPFKPPPPRTPIMDVSVFTGDWDIIPGLYKCRRLRAITHFTFRLCGTETEIKYATKILHDCGDTLSHMQIHFTQYDNNLVALKFGDCRRLRRLQFNISFTFDSSHNFGWTTIINAVTDMSPTLTHFILSFQPLSNVEPTVHATMIEMLPWHDLQTSLLLHRSLQRISILLDEPLLISLSDDIRMNVERRIQSEMLYLTNRALIHFSNEN